MAVELMMGSYRSDSFTAASKMVDQESTVEEAASAGLQSVEKLIRMLSQRQQQQHVAAEPENPNEAAMENIDLDCRAVADVAVNKFRKVISLLGRTRTGHARFRRGPVAASSSSSVSPPKQSDHEIFNPVIINTHQNQNQNKEEILKINPSSATRVYCPTPIQRYPPLPSHQNHHQNQNPQFSMNVIQQQKSNSVVCERKELSSTTINFTSPSISSTTTSFMSSLTGDTDMKHQPSSSSGFQITGRPPLSSSSSMKRKCMSSDDAATKCAGSSGRCHCSKRKKPRVMKRVVRVPAISLRMADIPPDDYSWRKYGQKPIKGSPHPRGYYRCSTLKNCPARKHVERALDDPTMLIITYEGEHNHSHSITDAPPLILESS